jgi:sialic acid synthase SpsE
MTPPRTTSKFRQALTDHTIPYIIAETAYIHEGDPKIFSAILTKLAEHHCADAVKYHILLDVDAYITHAHHLYNLYDTFKLPPNTWENILQETKQKGFETIVLADEKNAIDFAANHPDLVTAVELHAIAINNFEMLDRAKKIPQPVILGVGGSTQDDIHYALDYLDRPDILLTYGFQIYPTKFEYINLNKLTTMQHTYHVPIGYADHTSWDHKDNTLITVAGFIKGANFIEKHVTLTPGEKRIDYESAISIYALCEIKRQIELLTTTLGTGSMELNDYEKAVASNGPMKFTLVATHDLHKGHTLNPTDITFKRTEPENPIQQRDYLKILGTQLTTDVKANDSINWTKVKKP